MEKKFMCENSLSFIEAKLVKSQSRQKDKWYIEFWQGSDSSTLERFRPTFNLNRIISRRERKKIADEFVEQVNELLEKGNPASAVILEVKKNVRNGRVQIVENPFPQRLKTVVVSIEDVVTIKCKDASDASKATYKHISDLFKKYLLEKKLSDKRIVDFSKSFAIGFMDWLLLRGIGNQTYNNRLTEIKILFGDLLRRDYIIENPFNAVVPKKVKKKKEHRRCFTDEEAAIVGREIFEKSIWLFRAILLENYCGIRPTELRRLKFKHFDFSVGIIELGDDVVFKSQPRVATIPKIVLEYFLMPDFIKESVNNFVFGERFHPNPLRPVSRNYCTKKHREVLLDLKERGLLHDLTGLMFYSWKNTGITNLANDEKVGLFRTQNQVGHASPEETMQYYRQSKVDTVIQDYDKKIF